MNFICPSLTPSNHTGIFRGEPAFNVNTTLHILLKVHTVSHKDRRLRSEGPEIIDSMLGVGWMSQE
jgi:hypothetical protein